MFVFSAYGGIRTGSTNNLPVWTAYKSNANLDSLLSRVGLDILGEGKLFVAPPLEDCSTGLTGSSIQAGTGCTNFLLLVSSVADCQSLT